MLILFNVLISINKITLYLENKIEKVEKNVNYFDINSIY